MGAAENKSMQEEDQNTIALSKDGIISYLNNKLNNFNRKSVILSNLTTFMNEKRNNSLHEDYKWTNYKNGKYTEKGIEIFSCELNCSPYDDDPFELRYYYYKGYYKEYSDFNFVNSNDEDDFNAIRETIDANFNNIHKNKVFKNENSKEKSGR